MIDPAPSDEALRGAHLITLFDPQVPEWTQVLFDRVIWGRLTGIQWVVIDIPVDSKSPDAIEFWKGRVKDTRPQVGQ